MSSAFGDLRVVDAEVLAKLAGSGEPMTFTELSAAIDRISIRGTLEYLLFRGLVRRMPAGSDPPGYECADRDAVVAWLRAIS